MNLIWSRYLQPTDHQVLPDFHKEMTCPFYLGLTPTALGS